MRSTAPAPPLVRQRTHWPPAPPLNSWPWTCASPPMPSAKSWARPPPKTCSTPSSARSALGNNRDTRLSGQIQPAALHVRLHEQGALITGDVYVFQFRSRDIRKGNAIGTGAGDILQ